MATGKVAEAGKSSVIDYPESIDIERIPACVPMCDPENVECRSSTTLKEWLYNLKYKVAPKDNSSLFTKKMFEAAKTKVDEELKEAKTYESFVRYLDYASWNLFHTHPDCENNRPKFKFGDGAETYVLLKKPPLPVEEPPRKPKKITPPASENKKEPKQAEQKVEPKAEEKAPLLTLDQLFPTAAELEKVLTPYCEPETGGLAGMQGDTTLSCVPVPVPKTYAVGEKEMLEGNYREAIIAILENNNGTLVAISPNGDMHFEYSDSSLSSKPLEFIIRPDGQIEFDNRTITPLVEISIGPVSIPLGARISLPPYEIAASPVVLFPLGAAPIVFLTLAARDNHYPELMKAKVFDLIRDARLGMVKAYLSGQAASPKTYKPLIAYLEEIYNSDKLTWEEKKAKIFLEWNGCAESSGEDDPDINNSMGQTARKKVIEFIKKRLAKGSPRAYTPLEIAYYNMIRVGKTPFDPYGKA